MPVGFAEQDEFVTGLHSPRLQRAQQRERLIPQFGKSQQILIDFSVDKSDLAVEPADVVQQLIERIVELHGRFPSDSRRPAATAVTI